VSYKNRYNAKSKGCYQLLRYYMYDTQGSCGSLKVLELDFLKHRDRTSVPGL